jgi:hypothetical protein
MDQTEPQDQDLSRDQQKRGVDPDLDCPMRLSVAGFYQIPVDIG